MTKLLIELDLMTWLTVVLLGYKTAKGLVAWTVELTRWIAGR